MVNREHKFIFIHIPKTAGESLEEVLFPTTQYPRYYGFPRNIDEQKISKEIVYGLHIKHGILSHLTLGEMTKFRYITNRERQDYFKFCFVRNPWSRAVSEWRYYCKINNEQINFKTFTRSFPSPIQHTMEQYKFVFRPKTRRHIKTVDFIGKFENLQEDFNTICDKIGIPQQQLPHKNKTKHKHYTEYYDDETREIVAKKYAKDIKYFGYKFGE